jgi:hypothetical protein
MGINWIQLSPLVNLKKHLNRKGREGSQRRRGKQAFRHKAKADLVNGDALPIGLADKAVQVFEFLCVPCGSNAFLRITSLSPVRCGTPQAEPRSP